MRYQRYATYKDSGVAWLGQVPAHWEVKRLKHIFHIVKRIAHSDEYDVLSVTQKGIKIKDLDSNEGQLAENYSHYQIVNIGDFVMNHMDLITGYVDISKYLGVTSPDYRVFQSHDESNNNEYLLRLLQMCYHQKLFFPFGQGSSQLGRWRLPTDGFLNFLFPLPPLAEQQAIAAYLDHACARIDTLVAAQQRLIALLKEQRQALIAHTVTQGLDPAAPRKDSGVAWLGQVPAHWEVKRLKTTATVIPSNIDKKSYEDELPILLCNYTDVYYNSNITADMSFMQATASAEQIQKFSLIAGDLIITKDSETADDIAIPAYVPYTLPNVVCGYHLAIIRCINISVGKYLYYYFLSTQAKSYFKTRANGLTRVGLGQSAIGNLTIPLPPLAEQQAIAAYLDHACARIDTLVAKAEQAIALLQERRAAVIAAAVTGQIMVRN